MRERLNWEGVWVLVWRRKGDIMDKEFLRLVCFVTP